MGAVGSGALSYEHEEPPLGGSRWEEDYHTPTHDAYMPQSIRSYDNFGPNMRSASQPSVWEFSWSDSESLSRPTSQTIRTSEDASPTHDSASSVGEAEALARRPIHACIVLTSQQTITTDCSIQVVIGCIGMEWNELNQ